MIYLFFLVINIEYICVIFLYGMSGKCLHLYLLYIFPNYWYSGTYLTYSVWHDPLPGPEVVVVEPNN